ncbi:Phosphoenolpyruvate carboxylase [Fimbriiglobus ruber]|uniref:Phosphoenolpyruvate carboxylase n=1 Tax=Fimbriiglobus ruber TaxID=1908690 RepID=A0A225DBZ3_9BACT|nr:Phosphoenolpyruvate carboxylase [Fimbriiglobus ruber]
MLDQLLGETIRKLAGDDTHNLFSEIGKIAVDLRTKPSVDQARGLRDRLDQLDVPTLRTLIRAFRVYFDLINLAEQHARVRAIRERVAKVAPEPMAESAEAALRQLRASGVAAKDLDFLLRHAMICPVFTAHPSEARRLTVLEKLTAISHELDKFDYSILLAKEKVATTEAIAEQIETLWQTAAVRTVRPGVLDEVRQALEVVEGCLFDVVPQLYRDLERSLRAVYPERKWDDLPSILRFGSWIGGDRDGNPFVTHDVTAKAVRLHQETILKHYLERVKDLGRRLSHSAEFVHVGPEFQLSLDRDAKLFPNLAPSAGREPYRGKCRYIAAKLQRTLDYLTTLTPHWSEQPVAPPAGAYENKSELIADLAVIANDLSGHKSEAGLGPVRELMRLADMFGTHLMTLDVRQHADRHRRAMSEVLAYAGVVPAYDKLSSVQCFECLAKELPQTRPLIPAHLPYSEETCEVVQTFRTIAAVLEQQCPDAIETYIISGTGDAAHLLEVLLFAREARLFRPIDGVSRLNIVPLFETHDALVHGTSIVQALLKNPVYRQHLELRGNRQEVMIGYSDSNKESGFVQSAWSLYAVQRDLADLSRKTGIQVQIFHGRGGAVGRGGGPANSAILAQPRGSINGRLKITEQGEMIADRYGHPAIAERHLDQIINAVLRASLSTEEQKVDHAWVGVMDLIAEKARRHYRALVYENPEFLSYFMQATPINEISQLKLGSRPARRTTSPSIETLRAIPWVFSWMQSRHTLPGWYGLGSAVTDVLAETPEAAATLKAMYQGWHFWRTLIDNAQMILAKADLTIARLYADLIDDQEIAAKIYGTIATEYQKTVDAICLTTDQTNLLERVPILQASIARRNPYVDPLSFIQLVLLKRLRAGTGSQDELLTGVLESINGVASGLKNTG